ncbi:MAG: hypothetical protein HXY34_13040 [Candidatus Thorarchaeota archaeon]|nr:hypothetical protein [Candidatus Thorarchaeota archaeon]
MVLSAYEVQLLAEPILSQSTVQHFRDRYGKRFVRALKLVEEGRVIRYHFSPSGSVTWIVRGRAREYLTVPDLYCSCRSFYQSVVIKNEFDMCYHMLAQKIAEIRKAYLSAESTDSERRRLFVMWRRTD